MGARTPLDALVTDALTAESTGWSPVLGIGVDAVELARFSRVLARTPRFVDRVFTPAEVAYARRRRDPTERFAVRFAAKEAVLKAMGQGLWSCPLTDIEVVRADSGEPAVVLHDAAAALATAAGVRRWAISLTHTEVQAVAVAVAFGSTGAEPGPRAVVRIRASDPAASVAFYRDEVGMAPAPGPGTQLALGSLTVQIVAAGTDGAPTHAGAGPIELHLEVDDLATRTGTGGVGQVVGDGEETPRTVVLADPDGVVVRLVERRGTLSP
jgi:holo-[acyl-carrier protein] synthase